MGIVGLAVGAPFAVLVAEQLFVSGCRLLLSMTSAGQIVPDGTDALFRADRPCAARRGNQSPLPAAFDCSQKRIGALADRAWAALAALPLPVHRGTAWTTDAPYRETEEAIGAARKHGALAVEMEAAALYAFARARKRDVLCFAHVTNQMAVAEGDFEKGEAAGARDFARRDRHGSPGVWVCMIATNGELRRC